MVVSFSGISHAMVLNTNHPRLSIGISVSLPYTILMFKVFKDSVLIIIRRNILILFFGEAGDLL